MFPSFCRVTGHSRGLPRPNYFPILPPISPAEAKRFRTSGCRITSNFNPNHSYQPITKLIEESVIKCRITEKSVYEYKYFFQPNFGDTSSSSDKENKLNNEEQFYYYELEDKVLVVPKSVEKELNRGAIRDVHISEDNNKIEFKYLNRIKEYDLISECTDKLKELKPLKGKGLKKNVRKRRKKSALLGDLKSIFEQKEKLAEIAEKKAQEKIQPDSTKIELIKSKITSSKAPVFGYMDHNNKFTEITGDEELPKHIVKGQMQSGAFTPGELINDGFIQGKYIDNVFTPGIIKDNEFVPGNYIEREVDGKLQKKFIPGKVMNGLFTPGQMIKTSDGTHSEFIPGQVLTLENNEKKFVPGLLIEHVENDVLDLQFVPGRVEETNNSIKFTPGELIETNEGLKFVCEKVDKDSFEIQTFDNTFDFDLEDVKAAAVVCDTLNDFVRPDAMMLSSFDQQDSISTNVSAGPHNNASRKASNVGIDSKWTSDETLCPMELKDNDTLRSLLMEKRDAGDETIVTSAITVLETVKENAVSLIQQICSEMNLSKEETADAIEKVLQALKKQEVSRESSEEMEIDYADTSRRVDADFIFEKVTHQVASIIQPLFSQLQNSSNKVSTAKTVEKVIQTFVSQEVIKSLLPTAPVTLNYDKVKQKAPELIQQISLMMNPNIVNGNSNLSANAPDAAAIQTSQVVEKVLMELVNANVLQSALFASSSVLQQNNKSNSTLQTVQKEAIIKEMCSKLNLPIEEITLVVENILEKFSEPSILQSLCDTQPKGSKMGSHKLKESPSAEKVLEDCKKLLVEGYNDEYLGESEVKAADMLKDHVENQLTRDLNEALLVEALHLAQVLGKADVVRELESVLQDDINYETVVNDDQVLFILRQLVILKKLMAADNENESSDMALNNLNSNPELIRDAQMLTEFVFAHEERERYYTPPCEDIQMFEHRKENATIINVMKIQKNIQKKNQSKSQTEGQGVTVFTEESSSFFSAEGTVQAKRARLATDDPEFDDAVDTVELLDTSAARHKIEMGRSRHQKKKISLKSAEELQSTTSEQLAIINKEATLRELIETEEEFVRDLSFVIDNYYTALVSGNKLAKYRDLFGSLKPIYEFHQGILLEGFRYYINEPKMIGRTFLRLERYFDNHAEYFSEEEAAQALLRDDMEISEYFEDLTLSLGDEKTLSDHLKLPLQRINDYQLILQDLIDTQRILKEETTDLEKALDLLLSIPQKLSDKKFLSNIECSSSAGFHGNVFHLGRLLRHDWFQVTREDLNEVKQRYTFLFKTRILITKVRKISEERSVFILKDIVKLPEFTLEQVDDNKFILRGVEKVYIFESQTGNIVNEWSDIIQQCLQPDIAAAQRNEENIKQLKREGSLRGSRQTSLEPRRPSSVDLPPQPPPVSKIPGQESTRKLSEASIKKGLTIEEISVKEAEKIEQSTVSTKTSVQKSEKIETKTTTAIKEEVALEESSSTKKSVSEKKVEVSKKEKPVVETKPEKPSEEAQTESNVPPSSEQIRQLRRRSSVINVKRDSIGMASETPPVFVKPLRSSECEPGDNAVFECTTEVPVIINWLKGNRPLDDTLADRVKITSKGNKHSLQLLNCRDEDSGLYTAKITDEKFGVATCSAVLTVHELTAEERQKKIAEKNSPQFLVKFKDTELLKDTRVSFMFVVKGQPEPTLTFLHDGMILQTETERSKIVKHPDDAYEFSIEKISDEDAGEYVVKAENKHGTAEVKAKVAVVDEKELFKGIEGKRLLNPGEEPSFDWYLNGRPFTPDEKLKVMFREEEDTLALIFQHVTPDDAGLYTCVAQTSGGKISCSAELTVQGAIHQLLKEPCPPTITAELCDTEVSVGGSAMMELKVTGFPKPTVTWFKNGKEELKAGGRFRFLYEDEESIALIIKNVTKEDAGLYVVKAVNDLGEAETKGKLIVKAPPRFVKKMVDMSCMTEEKLAMDVIVEGSPKPEVKWYKDGQLIIASERIKFTELEDGRFQITIERVTLEDSGAYSVVASNAIGQMSEFWNLVAQQPAKIIRKFAAEHITELGSKGNQLNFSVQGVPEPTVTSTSSSGKQLKVDNLGGGEYRVNFDCTERQNIKVKAEVKNDFGSDSCECQVNVRRSAKIVSQLQNMEVKEGEEVLMKVKVDCYPKPSKVNWFIDGVEISGKKYETSDNGDEYSLKIKGVEKKVDSNKLNVQIKVENELGGDDCSASITIKSKPTIKKGLDSKYRIVDGSKNQELNVEVNATFPEPKGTWYHNGKEVEADARIKITKKSSETYNLTFNVVKYEDAGEWSFKAQNEVGEVWSKTTVIVEGKPTFKKGLPAQLEVIESEKMELDVMVQDFCEENVKITWTLDSNVKLESKETYNKEDSTASSKITFVPTAGCQKLTVTATNKHGETETRSELVHVNLIPPVIKKPLEKEVHIQDGQKNVQLSVEIDGMPKPRLSWMFNGSPLSAEKYPQSFDGEKAILTLPVFSSANVGQYTVEAVNVAGQASNAGSVKMLQTKPSFTKGLEPAYEFKEGLEDLVLSVDVSGSPIPIVCWMKDGVELDPSKDPRVTITNADGKSTLRVKNIDPKDKGRYSVSLKNPNGAAESNTNVTIKPTPRKPVLLQPLEYPRDVNKKEKIEIKAKIDGEPMPNVTFYHNDKPLQPHLWKIMPDGLVILTIPNVQAEDQGVYSIKLDNEAGSEKVDTETINVHEPPQRPGIEPPLTAQRVVEGLPFAFKATLKGYPMPELTLEKDGTEVKDINYDKNTRSFEYGKPKSEVGDAGMYKLIAKNASGQVASEGKLEIVSRLKDGPKYAPKFISDLCDKSVDEGNELILFAKVDGNPLPVISWTFNGAPLSAEKYPQSFDGEKAILRLPIAERENQGMYKCVLENDEGTTESASNVTVNKIYKPPSFAQKFTDQEQIPACDCKFGARVSGIPVPTARWFKDGTEIFPNEKYKMKQEGDIVQLYVRNCNDADKAVYTCLLANNQGTAECKAKLDVVKEISHKPRGEIPYFLKTIGNTEVYPGMVAKFTACVGGFPNPEFEWFKNGTERVFEAGRVRFERDGAGSGLIRLIIKDVDIADLADYRLRIWNEHGEAECSAYLKFDSLADMNKQKLGELYSGFEDTRPTAIPNRPLITNMNHNWMTLKWDPCLPHVSRIPCTYLVEMCPVDQPDNWSTLFKGLKNNYCDIEFPNPKADYKFRIRVQWGQNHTSEPSPYAITMRNKFDTRPPQWKPVLVPSIPRSYDLSHPPHDGYIHAPRFLNREHDDQYAQLGHPASVYFYVYGFPKPTLKFYRSGKEYNPEHTYLDNGLISIFINRFSEDLEGEYECEAKNSHGIARQKVQIHRADHPRFITRPHEVYALARRGGKISARIYGIPVPEIKIYKDWHLLHVTADTRVRLQIIDVDQYTIDVHVSIDEVLMRDEGLYSIVATNVAGSIHSSSMIHVEECESDYYFFSNLKGKDIRLRNQVVRNYYDYGDEIGRGTQAIHHHVVERSSGGSYASKMMITKYDPRRKEWIDAEYNAWNGLNHRYISRLHDAFYHDDTYTFISDICTGGDLLYSLISRESFTEYEICFYVRQLLEGLEYLHVQNRMAHLSLTPLDLLMTHINSNSLRIIDFSLAQKYFNKSLEYGHPEYVSPEIVRGDKTVGPWCDMWAVGIITYVLLSGHSPFLGQNDRETLENVKNGAWNFGDRFGNISDKAKDFIKRLLVFDFKDRMDIQSALDHSWFHILHEESTNYTNILQDLHSSYYYKLKSWNDNASCRTIYRRNPLETAYTDPSKMVYPPNYNEDNDYKLPIPVSDHLKLNGYPRPEAGDFVNESHYQSGDETYLLQLRDTDFPARLRQYMKVAANSSPSFQFQVYNSYCERNIPVIRERRKFTDVMDEEVDDEKRSRITNYGEGPWNSEPRRLRHEVGNRLDFQAEADALRSMKRDGHEPVFREKPSPLVNVRLGQEVVLTAYAAGDPTPTIQFFKNDMMTLSPGENREIVEENGRSTLTLKEIRETDLTTYKIVARNKSGQIISRFRLRLSDEPLTDDSVPESLNYEIEATPVNISTDEIKCSSPLQIISHGKFSSVILAENSRLIKSCTEAEFNTTKKIAHVNLFTIHEASQIGSSILLEDKCLNYESSCNLLHYVSSLDSYSEQLIMNFVSQILDGLQYLHWQGLALLNLEPGNVLVTKSQKIKLADFSATQPVLKIGSRVDLMTDPQFTAPEVLNGESQCMPQTDTWNVGLLVYIMLSGVSPFLGDSEEDTKQNVTYVRFRFEHLHKTVSQEATRLLMLIFKRSPLKRPTADECIEHRWFQLSDHMTKKREKSVFETTKIKEYYSKYLEAQKSKREESINLQDFIGKYGTLND